MVKLFIDDLRDPPEDDWIVCRSSQEAIQYVEQNGIPDLISFDHDLGDDDTTRKFVLWLLDELVDKKIKFPDNFKYVVHSANPVGAEWIRGTMDFILRKVDYE